MWARMRRYRNKLIPTSDMSGLDVLEATMGATLLVTLANSCSFARLRPANVKVSEAHIPAAAGCHIARASLPHPPYSGYKGGALVGHQW